MFASETPKQPEITGAYRYVSCVEALSVRSTRIREIPILERMGYA